MAHLRRRLSIRRIGRRIRRRLGLPALRRRAALWILLVFIGVVYVSVTVLADFFVHLNRYAPQYHEPKDFQREETPRGG